MGNMLGLLLWLTVISVTKTTARDTGNKDDPDPLHHDVIIPYVASEEGHFLHDDLRHIGSRRRFRRDTATPDISQHKPLYIGFHAFGKNFHINLTKTGLFSNPGTLIEYFHENRTEIRSLPVEGHYAGTLVGERDSRAVVTFLDGMHGVLMTSHGKYFIEPLQSGDRGRHHRIMRSTDNHPSDTDDSIPQSTNDVTSGIDRQESPPRRRRRRSVSRQRYVETLVVADKTMVAEYGKKRLENHLLTMMNIVTQLYRDASIGNLIQIVVSRVVVLLHHQPGLYLTHHADKSLQSFCQWQKSLTDPKRKNVTHDNAILITRRDICTYRNSPCATLGLAPVAGMCDPDRSCSIIEDIGLASAFTIAHELGHNFGMHHDGSGNICGLRGHPRAGLMAAQITRHHNPYSWSICSKDYITQFLDSGQAECLNNLPIGWNQRKAARVLHPWRLHSAHEQCRMQFGEESRQCPDDKGEVCKVLWCHQPNDHCLTHHLPAIEGTACSSRRVKRGWCIQGRCVRQGYRPRSVHGGWGQWSSWGDCSRSCGGGIQAMERLCNNPWPRHGGRYCIGERRRYRLCNTEECSNSTTSFRDVQCSSYNHIVFRGAYYKWIPYTGSVGGQSPRNPCVLYCKAEGYNFFTERSPKVIDGTKCYPGSRDVCINGHCKPVGCDNLLGSGALEDKCGICGGNGSTCQTVSGVFNKNITRGIYADIIEIPAGSTNMRIEEIQKSRNYLALKSADGDFYVNGGWVIDWSVKTFSIGGTVFNYARPGNKPEFLEAKGPINRNVIASVLSQEKNKGIHYSFNVPLQEGVTTKRIVTFAWTLSHWSACSKSCAKGIKKRMVVCVRQDDKTVVSETYCNPDRRPKPRMRECNKQPCPARWAIGKWSSCSVTCGKGYMSRDVTCLSQVDALEQVAVSNKKCEVTEEKPATDKVCQLKACPARWSTGDWRNCTARCGTGYKVRPVYCVTDGGPTHERYCEEKTKPKSKERCNMGQCRNPEWVAGKWAQCTVSCGDGFQKRLVKCRTYFSGRYCSFRTRPSGYRTCSRVCAANLISRQDCTDVNTVHYCPLVSTYGFCNRTYFRKLCCKTCAGRNAG